MTKHMFFVLALLFCLSPVCSAQDQVETINDRPSVLDKRLSDKINATDLTLSRADARAIIQETLKPDGVDDPNFYCIIHILKWKDDQLVIKTQRWYLYRGGAWSDAEYGGLRIFGSSRVVVLYIHVNARGLPSLAGFFTTEEDRKKLETGLDSGAKKSTNDRVLSAVGSARVESDYLQIVYKVEVTKKLPAPVQNLLAAIGAAQGKGDTGVKTEPIALWGGREMTIKHVPSDVTVRALQGEVNQTELGKQTYDNEGRYFWDVSMGLPVSKINELSFSAQDGTVRPKEIDRQKLFAMINIFFKPIDTKGVKPNLFPHLLAGVALSKKPLDRIFVGGGLGLNKVQVFAGVAFNRVASPQTLTAGTNATQSQLEADLKYRYEPKFVFGLNLPVRQVVDALKAKK